MKALSGIKILDLSRVLAGPFCTQMLGDLGADVLKVESPRGDDTRRWGPPFKEGESAYYLSTNRSKRAIAVNLKDPRGQALVKDLAAKADVLVENFKTGDMQHFGLDYATLSALNERLVYASITGFGQDGPRAKEPGYDVALQAMTGIMSVTGQPDGEPTKVGVAWIDILTGLNATIGILAAINERHASGKGQHIDLALFDVGISAMANLAGSYLMSGNVPQRLGNGHAQIVPYQTFEASDAWFMLAVGNDGQYRHMTEAIGHPELWDDPRFQSNAGRVAARGELVGRLVDIFRTDTRDIWLDKLKAVRVPVAPINDLAGVFADPQAVSRNVQWIMPHPQLGDITTVANPLQHMSRTPAEPTASPPLFGQHNHAALHDWLGLADGDIDDLVRAGVVAETRTD